MSSRIEVVIELIVNGESRSFPAPLTLARLIELLELTGKRIAVERNGEIVPRSQHAETALVNGDRLEVVVAVGGG
jgi:sulfur carrier protein